MIRLLVIDDHMVVREAVQRITLETSDLEFAGAAASISEAIAAAPEAHVGLVDFGVVAEDEDGIQRLREALPETRLVLLTDGEPDDMVRSALRAGAIAVVPKTAPVPHLLEVVRHASGGGRPDRPQPKVSDSPLGRLTPREREVLALLVKGRTNRDAAAALGISPRTVSSHIASIYRKLQTGGRVATARLALQLGVEEMAETSASRLGPDA